MHSGARNHSYGRFYRGTSSITRGRTRAAAATTVPKRRRVSPTPGMLLWHALNDCRRSDVVLGAYRSRASVVRRTPHRRSRRDLESVPTTPQWFCGILRTIVGGQTWFSAPTDRAWAPSHERRRDGADVTMRWDLRRRNWFCGTPRSFCTTQTCLSEHLDHPPMPTGGPRVAPIGPRRRRDRRDVFLAYLKPSSWLGQVRQYA